MRTGTIWKERNRLTIFGLMRPEESVCLALGMQNMEIESEKYSTMILLKEIRVMSEVSALLLHANCR
jgi:hypothetical protein